MNLKIKITFLFLIINTLLLGQGFVSLSGNFQNNKKFFFIVGSYNIMTNKYLSNNRTNYLTDNKTINNKLKVKIFPNPAKDYLQIYLPTSESKKMIIKLLSTDGKVLKKIETQIKNYNTTIQLSDLQPNIYILQITNGIFTKNFKVIKQ